MSRDPETVQREIEQARDGLAQTLDALADRTSPRRLADRGRQELVGRLRSPEVTAVVAITAGVAVLMAARRVRRAQRERQARRARRAAG